MCECGHAFDDHTREGFCLVVYCECVRWSARVVLEHMEDNE